MNVLNLNSNLQKYIFFQWLKMVDFEFGIIECRMSVAMPKCQLFVIVNHNVIFWHSCCFYKPRSITNCVKKFNEVKN